jgi:hypothetical protein
VEKIPTVSHIPGVVAHERYGNRLVEHAVFDRQATIVDNSNKSHSAQAADSGG